MNILKYKRKRNKNFFRNIIIAFSIVVLLPVSLSLFFLFRTTIDINIEDKTEPITETAANNQPKAVKKALNETKETLKAEKENVRTLRNIRSFFIYQAQNRIPFLQKEEKQPEIEIKDYNDLVGWLLTSLKSENKHRLLNTDKPLRAVYVYEETLIVDLNIDVLEIFKNSRLKETQVLYAMVNSLLINLPYDRIRFLFGGRNPDANETKFCFERELRFNPQFNLK
jgi:hypothetical protein